MIFALRKDMSPPNAESLVLLFRWIKYSNCGGFPVFSFSTSRNLDGLSQSTDNM